MLLIFRKRDRRFRNETELGKAGTDTSTSSLRASENVGNDVTSSAVRFALQCATEEGRSRSIRSELAGSSIRSASHYGSGETRSLGKSNEQFYLRQLAQTISMRKVLPALSLPSRKLFYI